MLAERFNNFIPTDTHPIEESYIETEAQTDYLIKMLEK